MIKHAELGEDHNLMQTQRSIAQLQYRDDLHTASLILAIKAIRKPETPPQVSMFNTQKRTCIIHKCTYIRNPKQLPSVMCQDLGILIIQLNHIR